MKEIIGKVYSKVVKFTDWENFFGEVFNDIGWAEVIEPKEPPRKVKVKKESKVMEKIIANKPPISFVKEQMLKAGGKFGSVWFIKREDGSLRKMCFKLHVQNPKYIAGPNKKLSNLQGHTYWYESKGGITKVVFSKSYRAKMNEIENKLMVVYDCNKPIRDKAGKIIGKGQYRSVPLDSVVRICAGGEIVEIEW